MRDRTQPMLLCLDLEKGSDALARYAAARAVHCNQTGIDRADRFFGECLMTHQKTSPKKMRRMESCESMRKSKTI